MNFPPGTEGFQDPFLLWGPAGDTLELRAGGRGGFSSFSPPKGFAHHKICAVLCRLRMPGMGLAVDEAPPRGWKSGWGGSSSSLSLFRSSLERGWRVPLPEREMRGAGGEGGKELQTRPRSPGAAAARLEQAPGAGGGEQTPLSPP